MEDRLANHRKLIDEMKAEANKLTGEEQRQMEMRIANARGVAWWMVCWNLIEKDSTMTIQSQGA